MLSFLGHAVVALSVILDKGQFSDQQFEFLEALTIRTSLNLIDLSNYPLNVVFAV